MTVLKTLRVIASALMMTASAFAQTWTQTSAPSEAWASIACSADGMNFLAGNSSFGTPLPRLYLSTNGSTWTASLSVSSDAVASSADGSRLIALSDVNLSVYTSANSGSSWNQSFPVHFFGNWISVASSGDGNNLIALTDSTPGAVYTSQDGGNSFVSNSLPGIGGTSVACSADGSKLIAALNNGRIYTSTNFGATWRTNILLSGSWISVAASADGNKMVAAVYGAKIYTSTNAGMTWKTNNVITTNWNCVASSADGTKLISGINNGQIYSSTNSGTTWQTNNAPNKNWVSLAASADGEKVVAADGFGGLWITHNTPKPRLSLSLPPDQILLSWLIPSTNFVLQQSTNLVSWEDMADVPTLNPGTFRNELLFPSSDGNKFYRLKTP